MKATLAILWDNFHGDVKSFIMFIMVSSVTSNKSLRLMGYLLTRYHFPRAGLLYGFLVEKLNFQRNMFLTPPILHRDDKADCINSGSPSVDRNLHPDDVSVDCVHINKLIAPYSLPTCPWTFVNNSDG